MADKKAVPKKVEAKAAAPAASSGAKPAPAPAAAATATKMAVKPTAAERQRRIAEAAYFLAQRRGFAGGSAVQDWLTAERNVDAAIARGT